MSITTARTAKHTAQADVARGHLARGERFQGHVVSDCGAVNDIHQGHKLTADSASSALAVKAGCDNACICSHEHLGRALGWAADRGGRGPLVGPHVSGALQALGMFDPAERVPYANIPMSIRGLRGTHSSWRTRPQCSPSYCSRTRNNILPIKPDAEVITVIGPAAANADVLLGNYHGMNTGMVTLVEGIIAHAPEGVKVEYRPGAVHTAERDRARLVDPHGCGRRRGRLPAWACRRSWRAKRARNHDAGERRPDRDRDARGTGCVRQEAVPGERRWCSSSRQQLRWASWRTWWKASCTCGIRASSAAQRWQACCSVTWRRPASCR